MPWLQWSSQLIGPDRFAPDGIDILQVEITSAVVGADPLIALLQRVSEARVEIAGDSWRPSGRGLLVLVAVRPADDEASALRLLDRLLKYRIFADEAGKMNLSLQQIAGDLLLVPQFTLAADTRQGLRPGFSTAAPPDQGRRLFELLVEPRDAPASTRGERRIRRPHAGVAHQRRAGNFLAGELSFRSSNATEHASGRRGPMS